MNRKSGILLHISSLHGDYSIGSFGKEAMEFIDFLSDSGFTYWQTLPFCMADEYNSPYKSPASFGANPYFIDLKALFERGYLTEAELLSAKQKSPYLTEYERLGKERLALLSIAAGRVMNDAEEYSRVEEFIKGRKELYEAAEFLALREANGSSEWQKWSITEPDKERLFVWKFIQYEFLRQWSEIKKYANKKGIKVIGDLPIYVSLDSADVRSNPDDFLLDEGGYPTSVAGVPPDYFSEDGQLWGNPLYDWKEMKRDGYALWRKRIRHMLTLFDGIRIDHFRGFESYFSIPSGAESAREGKWIKGPGRKIIDVIRSEAKDKLIIAEDLGDITPKVSSLLEYSKFPGMRVLQFAFLGDEKTPHLPHNFDKNTVVYSATHDNNTLLGYIYELDNFTRDRVFDYFGCKGDNFTEACEKIKKALLASAADTVIFPIQDILVYGADTRMNTPGKACGNWAYRLTREQLFSIDRKKYLHLNKLYGR